jgi:hypothetical protein
MNILALCSSVYYTIVGFGTEEYNTVILLGIEKYKKTEERRLFSCSACR